jgi:hypothetical protein
MPGGATAEHIASAGRLGSGPALGPQSRETLTSFTTTGDIQ